MAGDFEKAFLAGLLKSFPEAIEKSQRENYNKKVLAGILGGQDIMTATSQPKVSGILENLFDVVNPRGTYRGGGMEDLSPITKAILMSKLSPMLEDPLDKAIRQSNVEMLPLKKRSFEANIAESEARTQAYKEGKTGRRITLTPSEERAGRSELSRMMNEALYGLDLNTDPKPVYTWGNRDATDEAIAKKKGQENKDALLNAWEDFQVVVDDLYPDLTPAIKKWLWNSWKNKVKLGGGNMPEPEDFGITETQPAGEVKGAGAGGQVQAQAGRTEGQGQSPYPEYPDAFLENGVWKVIRNGQKFRIEE